MSEAGKDVVKHGVTVIGTVNLPSTLPVHASQLYARNVLNFLYLLAPDKKELNIDLSDEIIKGSLITHNGEIVSPVVKEAVAKADISYPSGNVSRSHW